VNLVNEVLKKMHLLLKGKGDEAVGGVVVNLEGKGVESDDLSQHDTFDNDVDDECDGDNDKKKDDGKEDRTVSDKDSDGDLSFREDLEHLYDSNGDDDHNNDDDNDDHNNANFYDNHNNNDNKIVKTGGDDVILLIGWFFKGFWAFKCFGSVALEQYRSSLFALSDDDDSCTGNSCRICKKEEVKHLVLERSMNDTKGAVGDRGILVKDHAVIAQQDQLMLQESKRTQVAALSQLLRLCKDRKEEQWHTLGSKFFDDNEKCKAKAAVMQLDSDMKEAKSKLNVIVSNTVMHLMPVISLLQDK